MAGLFQVLYGDKKGGFTPAKVLTCSRGEPLIIAAEKGDAGDVRRICTRPFAVDLDGDGKLDIVSGNFEGTFAWFRGEGDGKFEAKSTLLGDGEVRVEAHSDPFFVDWDQDGDLDLVSGSSEGGVFLFLNEGSAKEPRFGERRTLVEATGYAREQKLGDAHITGPQTATRVWVDDLNEDGKLDLLVGDCVQLCFPVEGVSEAEAKQRLEAWNAKQVKVFTELQKDGTPDQKKLQKAWTELQKERAEFVRDEPTGFVWVFYGR